MGHEASVSKISEDQLFYLMSRGMTEDEAMATIVRGFVEPIARELPMEYALELNRLIELQMEGAVGECPLCKGPFRPDRIVVATERWALETTASLVLAAGPGEASGGAARNEGAT